MKIFYLSNIRFPTEKAHGIQIMKMCQSFVSAGHEVVLVVPKRFNQIKKSAWEFYGEKENFKIEYLKIRDFMKSIEIPRVSFHLQSKSFVKAVKKYLKENEKEEDIVYSRDIPIVRSLDSENVFFEMHTLPKSFRIKDLNKVKGFIVIAQILKNTLVKRGVSKDKIIVARDGVDLKQFNIDISLEDARKKVNLPQDKKIVLYSGHLYTWKGAQILAEASQLLNENVLVVFVGGTKKDIEKFKSVNRDLKNILILGHKPYSEIPYYLKAADVLVLPNTSSENISKWWTSPLKMFEYMVSKRPIVATELSSLREVLNKENALIVLPDDHEELAQGIEKLLRDADLSNKLAQRAYRDVKEYTWAKRAKKILNFLKINYG